METFKSKLFDGVRKNCDFLLEEIEKIEKLIPNLEKLNLPKQIIHGDLHYDNTLVHQGKLTGCLDFEFCAHDLRGMELAICLSKYCSESDPKPFFNQFIDGFVVFGQINQQEIDFVPDLINLRILSNVVYFVGRALSKEDVSTFFFFLPHFYFFFFQFFLKKGF